MEQETKKEILTRKKNKKTKNKSSWILWVVLIILVIVSGVVLFFNLRMSGYLDNIFVKDNNFYLIYLNLGNNNMTYYGQGLKEKGDYFVLENPFFLQPTTDESTGDTVLNLKKIEDNFYKPIAEMKIFKSSVILIQQLQSDSPVVQEYNKIK